MLFFRFGASNNTYMAILVYLNANIITEVFAAFDLVFYFRLENINFMVVKKSFVVSDN